jgi:hypothetical protein
MVIRFAASITCPLMSERTPVTVVRAPFCAATASCTPRPGATSTTLPLLKYKLRISPPGPRLKARIRDDCVTVGPCTTAKADAGAGGVCAKADVTNSTPEAKSFSDIRFFMDLPLALTESKLNANPAKGQMLCIHRFLRPLGIGQS